MTSKERRLMNAVRVDHVNTARRLLEDGVDINARDGLGNTAIMGVRSVEMLNLCLQHGANLNMKNKKLDSVLTVWTKRLDRTQWGETHLPPLASDELLKIWEVARRKGVDSTSENLDGKKAKSYLNMEDQNQRLLAGKLCSHEGHIKIKKSAEERERQQRKSEGKQ